MATTPNKKITRFGYIIHKKILSEEQINEVKKELTIKPFKVGNFSKFSKDNSFTLYLENDDYLGVPKYYGLEKFGEPDINRLEDYSYPRQKMFFTGQLRPRQQVIIEKVIKGLEQHRGGLLLAGCGSGKTELAIYAACHYKLKTLFLTHKTYLKNQIINRIKLRTNVKKVGIIQQKKVDVDKPFVVGMIQSLAGIKYDDKIFRDFGMVIIDEVHHMGARKFSTVYQKVGAKYMLGISAERKRNDGVYKIINWYMGPILHFEEQRPNEMVIVKKFLYRTSNTERSKLVTNKYTGEPDRSTMISNLVCIKKRNRLIINIIKECFDEGKNILCLTGRIRQVNIFYHLLNQDKCLKGMVGKYIGEMTEAELAISATKQIIIGTYNMAEEGLDIENLNVVILCTPKSAIKQSVGRILRKEIYEEHPIVIDIVDEDNAIFRKQSKTREYYYRRQQYHIQEFLVSDDEREGYHCWDDCAFLREALTRAPRDKASKMNLDSSFVAINYDEIQFLDDD